jgi:hypothetical protein
MPASERRQAGERRRREAWAERRCNLLQPHPATAVEESVVEIADHFLTTAAACWCLPCGACASLF